jgi:hypothetical protein
MGFFFANAVSLIKQFMPLVNRHFVGGSPKNTEISFAL